MLPFLVGNRPPPISRSLKVKSIDSGVAAFYSGVPRVLFWHLGIKQNCSKSLHYLCRLKTVCVCISVWVCMHACEFAFVSLFVWVWECVFVCDGVLRCCTCIQSFLSFLLDFCLFSFHLPNPRHFRQFVRFSPVQPPGASFHGCLLHVILVKQIHRLHSYVFAACRVSALLSLQLPVNRLLHQQDLLRLDTIGITHTLKSVFSYSFNVG